VALRPFRHRRASAVHDRPPPDVPALITQVEGDCFPRGWGGAGLFVRFYHGQDYYNLGFAEEMTRLQFGVTLRRDQFLTFRIKPM
jgi:hypothetical protein